MSQRLRINNADTIPLEPEYHDISPLTSTADKDIVDNSALCFSNKIVNTTNERITVKMRSGTEIILEPVNSYLRRGTLREVRIYSYMAIGDYARPNTGRTNPVGKDESATVETVFSRQIDNLIAKRNETNYRSTRNGYDTLKCRIIISREELINGAYIPDIDCVIFLTNSNRIFHHPESDIGKMLRRETGKTFGNGVQYNVEIYDQNETVAARWININGLVLRIPINRSGLRVDGIYVTYNNGQGTTSEASYTIEEGTKELRLYSSREEAKEYGDLKIAEDRVYEERKRKLEREHEEWKNSRDRERHDFELEIERQKQRVAEALSRNKHREHMYDAEKAEAEHSFYKEKSSMDRESARRKNFYELLKLVPATITAVLTIVILLKKKTAQ